MSFLKIRELIFYSDANGSSKEHHLFKLMHSETYTLQLQQLLQG